MVGGGLYMFLLEGWVEVDERVAVSIAVIPKDAHIKELISCKQSFISK